MSNPDYIFVIFIVLIYHEHAASPTEKIYGGQLAQPGEFPYMVYVKRDSVFSCGGAIISKKYILTTAFCVHNYVRRPFPSVNVVTGTINRRKGGEIHKVRRGTIHPKFLEKYPEAIRFDVGIITLCAPMKFNRYQKPVHFPTREVRDGEEAVVTGWGVTETNQWPDILMKLKTKVYSSENCTKAFNQEPFDDKSRICTISTKGKGHCLGDTGGPLVVNGEVVGLSSLTYAQCGSGRYDMYSYIYKSLDYILREANPDTCKAVTIPSKFTTVRTMTKKPD